MDEKTKSSLLIIMTNPALFFKTYSKKLINCIDSIDNSQIELLAKDIYLCWKNKKNIFFCGNGGSAGNSIHIVNDLIYGVAKKTGCGIKAHSLAANSAVLTCLGNDIGYDGIFSEQLAVLANKGDLLIALSGSGNSKNIIKAITLAKNIEVKTFAIVGYDGGEAKNIADSYIHCPINDMQVSEDLQLIIFHMIMQFFYNESKVVD